MEQKIEYVVKVLRVLVKVQFCCLSPALLHLEKYLHRVRLD